MATVADRYPEFFEPVSLSNEESGICPRCGNHPARPWTCMALDVQTSSHGIVDACLGCARESLKDAVEAAQ